MANLKEEEEGTEVGEMRTQIWGPRNWELEDLGRNGSLMEDGVLGDREGTRKCATGLVREAIFEGSNSEKMCSQNPLFLPIASYLGGG